MSERVPFCLCCGALERPRYFRRYWRCGIDRHRVNPSAICTCELVIGTWEDPTGRSRHEIQEASSDE